MQLNKKDIKLTTKISISKYEFELIKDIRFSMKSFITKLKELNKVHEDINETVKLFQELRSNLSKYVRAYNLKYVQNDDEFENNGYEFFGTYSADYVMNIDDRKSIEEQGVLSYLSHVDYNLHVECYWWRSQDNVKLYWGFCITDGDHRYLEKVPQAKDDEYNLMHDQRSHYFNEHVIVID